MANYDHSLYETLEEKFPEDSDILGTEEWRNYLEVVLNSNAETWDELVFERWRRIRDKGLNNKQRKRKCPRIFVSHRKSDNVEAERIAFIACNSNFEYWLDVHDPNLISLNGQINLTWMQRKWLTAGIIEMALINCTHVITVMTSNASGSDWIPYEYGRITEIPLKISRAGSWLSSGYAITGLPDYMLLGVITQSEPEIENWLSGEMSDWKSTYGLSANTCLCHWKGTEPTKLPDLDNS